MHYNQLTDLSGCVAVITGIAGGIGLETGRALASCGARVILADREPVALQAAKEKLETSHPSNCSTVVFDVTDPVAVEEAAKEILANEKHVDILVNSAGISPLNTALDTPDDQWRRAIDIDLNGVYWVSRAFGRAMVAARKGSIVNLGSMSGTIINRPQTAPSCMASKGGVHMLTKALAAEWVGCGVRVNAMAPGYVATDMTLQARQRPELFDVWMAMTPMRRCGEPEEIAAASYSRGHFMNREKRHSIGLGGADGFPLVERGAFPGFSDS